MTLRKPLVLISGDSKELPTGDTTVAAGDASVTVGSGNAVAVSQATAAPLDVLVQTAAVGTSLKSAKEDHKHNITTGTPSSVGTANSAGSATSLTRSDHVHDHGAQTSGSLHAAVVAAGASGFMTGTDKTKLDGIATGADVTLLATSAPQDVIVQTATIGSSVRAAKEDHKHNVTTAAPSSIGTANSAGSATSLVRSDHVHDHGTQSTTTHHAVATAGVAGFISGANQTKLDGISTGADVALTALAAAATNPAFNSKRLTLVADPSGAQDAATKNYVDTLETPFAVTYASSIALDVAAHKDFAIGSLTGDVAFTFTNYAAGKKGRILVIQDSTGSRAVNFTVPSGWSLLKDASFDRVPQIVPGTVSNFQFLKQSGTQIIGSDPRQAWPIWGVPVRDDTNPFNDEFFGDETDLAKRGWTCVSWAGSTTMTRRGNLEFYSTITLSSSQYNSEVIDGVLYVQCSVDMFVYKTVSLTDKKFAVRCQTVNYNVGTAGVIVYDTARNTGAGPLNERNAYITRSYPSVLQSIYTNNSGTQVYNDTPASIANNPVDIMYVEPSKRLHMHMSSATGQRVNGKSAGSFSSVTVVQAGFVVGASPVVVAANVFPAYAMFDWIRCG